jgi:hypothetical protein
MMHVPMAGGRRLVVAPAACALLAVYPGIASVAVAQDVSKLTTLTVEQATELAAKKPATIAGLDGYFWRFDSLTSLTPEVAEVLVKPKVNLSFNGLTELSPETAKVLADHAASPAFGTADLRLNGLKRLAPEAAKSLAAHQGMVLLYGLERLNSVPLAQKLARQWGELRLGLTELSPAIAAELAKHRGTEVSKKEGPQHRIDRAVSVLRIDRLASLTPEAAETLAAHEGVLVLNDLTSLDPEVAAALAKRVGNRKLNRPGTLVLNGLTRISVESAAALARFSGELVLKGITELNPATAAALATHKGRLHLMGLTTVSPEVAAALRKHPAVLLPRKPASDS